MVYNNEQFINDHLHALIKFREALTLIETAYGEKPQFRLQKHIIEMINEWIRIVEKTIMNCKLKEKNTN